MLNERDISTLLGLAKSKIASQETAQNVTRIFADEPKVDLEFRPDRLKSFERDLIDYTANKLYMLFATTPVVMSVAVMGLAKDKPKTVQDYSFVLSRAKTELDKFTKSLDDENNELINAFGWFCTPEHIAEYKRFMKFMDEIMPVFSYATKARKFCDSRMGDREFAESASTMNKKIKDCLTSGTVTVEDWFGSNLRFSEIYMEVLKLFSNSEMLVSGQSLILNASYELEQLGKQMQDDERRKLAASAEPVVSAQEQERRDYIKKANDMYAELCNDTMRDLQNQVPLSTRDMYEYFVDVKFAKFVKQFDMPLAANANLGVAREACAQLVNLQNYVSSISANSYTTSVYGE